MFGRLAPILISTKLESSPPSLTETPTCNNMATAVQQQTQATNRGRGGGSRGMNRGRRTNNRGRGRGGASVTKSASEPSVAEVTDELKGTTISHAEENSDTAATEEGEQDICWICAEKIKYFALGECNHLTCHVCALRLRALYKKNECTFCKVRIRAS